MNRQDELKAQLPPDFDNIRHLYYKKVIHPENERLKNHIFIRSNSIVRKVVAFSIDLILNKKFPNVILSAISKNMDKVVFIAELIKRKLKGLSQQTSMGTLDFEEVYRPKPHAKGREEFLVKRKTTILTIILDYRNTIDTTHYGYQRPLPLNLVSTKNPRDYVLTVINEYKNKRKGRWPKERVYWKKNQDLREDAEFYGSEPKDRKKDSKKATRGWDDESWEEDNKKSRKGKKSKHSDSKYDDYDYDSKNYRKDRYDDRDYYKNDYKNDYKKKKYNDYDDRDYDNGRYDDRGYEKGYDDRRDYGYDDRDYYGKDSGQGYQKKKYGNKKGRKRNNRDDYYY